MTINGGRRGNAPTQAECKSLNLSQTMPEREKGSAGVAPCPAIFYKQAVTVSPLTALMRKHLARWVSAG